LGGSCQEKKRKSNRHYFNVGICIVGLFTSKRRRKKRIRRIIDDAELAEETKIRMAEEKVLFQFNYTHDSYHILCREPHKLRNMDVVLG
jgi:hypothetical protein